MKTIRAMAHGLAAAAALLLVGCGQRQNFPVAEKSGGMPPADSPLGKRIREGLTKRGEAGQQRPGNDAQQSPSH